MYDGIVLISLDEPHSTNIQAVSCIQDIRKCRTEHPQNVLLLRCIKVASLALQKSVISTTKKKGNWQI